MSDANACRIVLLRSEAGEETTGLIRRTDQGAVRNVLSMVQLRQAQGHVYQAKVWNPVTREAEPRWALTAAGYYHLNQFQGVSFATPETLLAPDGRATGNPHIQRNPSGEIMTVKVRRIGVGRNAVGTMVAVDLTVSLDLQTYFAQDVWAEWSRGNAVKEWGKLYDADRIPNADRQSATTRLIPCPGGVVLAVDLRQMAVIKLLGEHINRQKFAERYAITVCERNILKKFLAITYAPENLRVPVVSWQIDDRSWKETIKLAEEIASTGGSKAVQSVVRESAAASRDDLAGALLGDVDEENRDAAAEAAADPIMQDADQDQALYQQTAAALAACPDNVQRGLLQASKIDSPDQISQLDRETCLNIIAEASQYIGK